jgi:hypothetical protein
LSFEGFITRSVTLPEPSEPDSTDARVLVQVLPPLLLFQTPPTPRL